MIIIIIKRPISSLKIENECTDFQNTVSPEAVPSLPPCDPTPVLVAGSARPALSSSGTGRAEGGRLLPSPAVCGTRGRLGSGCWPSSIHSSTVDR